MIASSVLVAIFVSASAIAHQMCPRRLSRQPMT
jgi:hypothetical protein